MNLKNPTSRFSWTTPFVIGACVALVMLIPLGCNSGSTTSTTDTCPAKDSLCLTREQFLAKGQVIFQDICTGCHGDSGQGGESHVGLVPPLRNSDFFMAQRLRPVRIVLRGLPNLVDTATTITVNGNQYTNQMYGFLADYSNTDIAAVLSFVRDSLNGGADLITVTDVKSIRDTLYAQ